MSVTTVAEWKPQPSKLVIRSQSFVFISLWAASTVTVSLFSIISHYTNGAWGVTAVNNALYALSGVAGWRQFVCIAGDF